MHLRAKFAKVFCFFSSEKKTFLSPDHQAAVIGRATDNAPSPASISLALAIPDNARTDENYSATG
jgi:hypothetical protein